MIKKKKQPFKHEGHKLRTRRDFFAQGYMTMATMGFGPSLYSMLFSRVAMAQEIVCAADAGGAGKAAFLCFDLAGGANIAGSNVLVGLGGAQENFLTSYETLGLPNAMHPENNINSELGLKFHSDSAFLRGILETTTPEMRANIEGAVFCTSSADDTNNNPFNPAYWIYKGGASGELAPLAGSRNNASGGNSLAPGDSINPTARPIFINRPQDALGLVDVGKLGNLLSVEKAEKVLKAIENLSESQLRKFNAKQLPDQVKDVVRCGYINSKDFVSKYSAENLDPSLDPTVTGIFGNMGNQDSARLATISKLVMDGYVGAGTITSGGYDYHDNSRATGERKDLEAGRMIGQSIALAAAKNRDLMVYVYTDGGVAAAANADNSTEGRGKFRWRGDDGQKGATFALVYKADGKVELRGSRQIGSYKEGGSVDNGVNKISQSVENLSKAIVANYLALHGDEGKLAQVVGDDPFGSELEKYLVFDKLR